MSRGEGTERMEDEGQPDGSLEDFRKEVRAEYGEEAGEGPGSEHDEPEAPPGGEQVAPVNVGETGDATDRLSDEELEAFRRQVLEEYGPEGLSEDTMDGQLYSLALEERARADEADAEAQEGPDRQAPGRADVEDAPDSAKAEGAYATARSEADGSVRTEPTQPERESQERTLETGVETGKHEAAEVYNLNDSQTAVIEQEEGTEMHGNATSEATAETSDSHRFRPNPRPEEWSTGPESDRGGLQDTSVNAPNLDLDAPFAAPGLGGFLSQTPEPYPIREGEMGREIGHDNQQSLLKDSGRQAEKGVKEESPDELSKPDHPVEVLRATGYGHTSALLIPERMIPSHDERSDLFEVRVARVSQPEREYPLYVTHKPGYERAYLNLYQLDPKSGEEFVAKPATIYSRGDFANQYNNSKPSGLENSQLIERNNRLYLRVGGSELPFAESKLRAYQGNAVLDGRIESIGEVKISKSLTGFDFRLKDHSRVTEFRTDEGVVLGYQRTRHDPYLHRRVISDPHPKLVSHDRTPERLSIGKIEVFPESDGNPRLFRLHVDEYRRESVRELLRYTRTPDEYRKIKGDLAEEIVRDLMPQLGMVMVADHPYNGDPLKTRSERTGPDLLVAQSDQALGYLEVKWWGSVKEALERGEGQVSSDLRKYPAYHGSQVTEGYVAVVDWNPDRDDVFLRVKKIASGHREGLK